MRCPVAGRTACPSLSLDGINLPARHHYRERDTHLRERLRELSKESSKCCRPAAAFLPAVRGEK